MGREKYLSNQSLDIVDELFRRVAVLDRRVKELENMLYRKHSPTHWLAPTLLNGFAQPAATVDQFAYRLTGGIPDFKGHIDGAGAISNTVAFTIPLDPDEMTLPGDVYFHTIVTDGATFQSAMVFLDSATGNVKITWPSA